MNAWRRAAVAVLAAALSGCALGKPAVAVPAVSEVPAPPSLKRADRVETPRVWSPTPAVAVGQMRPA